ncbi:MAG: DUF5058 family protein [Gracilibacteraceae bacterium]|nr:DUF5058 family protein [Gracilibacteraceae bacterium]
MSYFDSAGHWFVYLLVILGIIYIAGLTAVTLRRAWARALKIGYTGKMLRRVVKIAVTHSLLPAVAVLIGLFALAPILGIPLSWWRLSIIGNTVYEIMAADLAGNVAGTAKLAGAGARELTLTLYVMTIGIMGGLLLAPVLAERVQKGALKIKDGDRRWRALGSGSYITAILIAFAVPLLFSSLTALLTLLTAAAAAGGLNLLSRRHRAAWLAEFSFAIGMLAGMITSVFWTHLTG